MHATLTFECVFYYLMTFMPSENTYKSVIDCILSYINAAALAFLPIKLPFIYIERSHDLIKVMFITRSILPTKQRLMI